MGMDVATFRHLLDSGFSEYWDQHTLGRQDVNMNGLPRHRRRTLNASGGLGLLLHYLCSTMRENSLQQLFALTSSCCSRYLTFAMSALEHTFLKIPESRISWPRDEEFQRYSDMIEGKHGSILKGAFGFADGLNLPVQTSSDEEMENAYYNAWLHSHVVSTVLAFAPTVEFHLEKVQRARD